MPAVVLEHQARVAAQLSQAHELGQHFHVGHLLAGRALGLALLALAALARQLFAQMLLVGAVQLQLLVLKRRVHHAFQLVGQVGQHVGLLAA